MIKFTFLKNIFTGTQGTARKTKRGQLELSLSHEGDNMSRPDAGGSGAGLADKVGVEVKKQESLRTGTERFVKNQREGGREQGTGKEVLGIL